MTELDLSEPTESSDRHRLARAPSPPWWDRDPRVLGNAITPKLLSQIIADRNIGRLRDWIDFANEIRRNSPHLHSQLAIREESVVETDFVIEPGATDAASIYAADLARDLWVHWKHKGLFEWLAQIVAAAYYGRAAHEVVWRRDGALIVPERLVWIDERRLSLECDQHDPDPWRVRLWDQDEGRMPLYGIPLDDFGGDKVLVHTPRVLGGPVTAEGLASVVVWYVVFSIWSWRDLMALSELIGQQPVVGHYAAGGARSSGTSEFQGPLQATDEQVKRLERVVYGMSGALRAVLPDTTRLEVPKFNIPTGEPIQLLAEDRANKLISKAINGVANLSDLQPGARAAVESQERTTYTFWRSDCRRVAGAFAKLFAWMVQANPTRLAGVKPPLVRAADPTQTSTTPAGGKPPEDP